KRAPPRGRLLEAEKTDTPDMHVALVDPATDVHHAATERRIQPFVAAGRQEIDSELRTVDGECAELLYGVDHEKQLARLGEVGIGREIDSLTGNPADRAHQ